MGLHLRTQRLWLWASHIEDSQECGEIAASRGRGPGSAFQCVFSAFDCAAGDRGGDGSPRWGALAGRLPLCTLGLKAAYRSSTAASFALEGA